ncbi:MAG: NUDIX domain-containing protein [Reichenbachiella sp.]
MKIYINDIPVSIRDKKRKTDIKYGIKLEGPEDAIPVQNLKGNVLIENKSISAIDNLLKIITSKKYNKIKSIEIVVQNKIKAQEYLLSHFEVIEAAGGVVEKDDKILLILRNGLWDIPKGKLEGVEKKKEGAIREVEEETGAKVAIVDKISVTWHTYTQNKKFILKKTYWYRMTCLDNSKIKPQKEENIKKVMWMTPGEVDIALLHSYKTIKRVVKNYRKLSEK